jgi:hypothetical protein
MDGLVLYPPFIEISNEYTSSLLLCSNLCADRRARDTKGTFVARSLNFDTGPHVKQSFDGDTAGPG